MASSMTFEIFARDHASRQLNDVGDSADRAATKLDRLGNVGSALGGRMTSLSGPLSTLGGHMRGLLTSSASAGVALVGTAAKLATFAAAAASAASSAGGLVAALAPAVGAVAALPGALALGVAGMTTLKVALSGVSKAFDQAMKGPFRLAPEALDLALKNLAPAAQKVGWELYNLVPALDEIKNRVQQALFAPLQGELTALVQTLGGPVRDGMAGVAEQFGLAGAQLAEFARSAKSVAAVQSIFADLRSVVEALRPALEPLLAGFRDLAVVGSGFLAGLAPGLADAATRFGEFLSRASASGQALGWMQGALEVFKQLGGIAKDVAGILGGVFEAMRASGAGALGILGQLLDGMNKWVNSARGQAVLVEVFTALHTIGQAFLPVIISLAGAIGTLAPVVATLATAIGPILKQAIDAVAPGLAALGPGLRVAFGALGDAVKVLAPALVPFGQAISSIVKAAAPLIPIVAEIAVALAGVLTGALAAVIPGIKIFADAIAPAVKALGPGIADLFGALGSGIAALAPSLKPLAEAFSGILSAVAPLLPLAGALAQIFATALADGLKTLTPGLQEMVKGIGGMAAMLAPLIPQIIDLAAVLIGDLMNAVGPLLPVIGDIANVLGQFLVDALRLVVRAIEPLLPALSQVWQTIGTHLAGALREIAPLLLDVIKAWLDLLPALTPLLPLLAEMALAVLPPLVNIIKAMLPHAAEFAKMCVELLTALIPLAPVIADLVTRSAPMALKMSEIALSISEKLLPAAQKMIPIIADVVDKVIGAFLRLYDTLVGHSIIPDLVNGIVGWISSLPGRFAEFFGQAKDWAIAKFTDLINWVRGVPNAIVGALGNLGGTLGTVGHNMIIGFWNGMVGMFDWLKTSIYNFFAGIMPQWVKDALHIKSPSRLFADIGAQLPAGLALGMDERSGMVQSAAERMAGLASMTVSQTVTPVLPAGGAAGGVYGGGQPVQIIINFAGQPLIGRDEISRMVIGALSEARARGFNLGFGS